MKRLLLLRHAKSSWDDPSQADRDRPLAPRGVKAARRIAAYLAERGPEPQLVLCSSARRTRETLDLLAPAFGDAEVVVEDRLYGATADDLMARLREIADGTEGVAVIGHNPGMHELALTLVAERYRRRLQRFPTGALAVVELDGGWEELASGRGRLEASVTPKELA